MLIHTELKITQKAIKTCLFEFLVLINVFFALFPAWRLSPMWNYFDIEGYFNIWMNFLAKVNILICSLILICDYKIKSNNLFWGILLLFLTVAISIFVNGLKQIGSLITLFFFPIQYIVIFIISKEYTFGKRFIQLIKYIFAIWSVLPIFMLIFGPTVVKLALMSDVNGNFDTFGGLAFHRNFYGFYTGLTVMLFIIIPTKKWIKISVITLCLVGILLSASRSALLCTFVSIIIYIFYSNKRLFFKITPFLIFGLILLVSAYSYYGIRQKGIGDNDDRFELLYGFVEIIGRAPVWGQGEGALYYSSSYPDGSPAHNLIVQVWADYGIISLIIFLFILGYAFYKGNNYLKMFLSYLFLISLMQPYLYISMVNAFTVLTISFGNCFPLFRKKYYENERYRYIKS